MSDEYISEINLIYEIDKRDDLNDEEDYINIFGETFVENNKNICTMVIDNKEYKLEDKFNIENYNNNILKIKLKGINKVRSLGFLFDGCTSLISLPDISKLNTDNIFDMSYIFQRCESLES